jgi:hypothetical protein
MSQASQGLGWRRVRASIYLFGYFERLCDKIHYTAYHLIEQGDFEVLCEF